MSQATTSRHLRLSSTASADAADIELESFFPRSATLDPHDLDVRSIRPLWKRTLHELVEHPTSSQSAFIVHLLTTTLILFSAVVTVLETVPLFRSTSPGVWFGIETSLVALFTVEYISRAIAWSSSWGTLFSWFTSFFGIIDLLAILPYYIEIALQVDTSAIFRFSILRTFRLLRVFRSFRYNNTILLTIEVMYLSFKRSKHALLALGFFVVMFLVVFSTLLYFAERGSWDPILQTFMDVDGDPSQFSSIPAAAWFVLVTITTVGYGEITPRSILGRLITVPLLVFGLLLIALPSFVLGREFSIVWEMMDGNHDKVVPLRNDEADFTQPRSQRTSPANDVRPDPLLPLLSYLPTTRQTPISNRKSRRCKAHSPYKVKCYEG
ncbi:voltage-gated potassium channel [Rickenella mellea]|uniref:Voltage-gated potassium channel n=1 Tax=Rickenella mellea TaxID=50990 RepID=A0A4Y7Q392_9AGAM|nr:voltage-gated potassium channel [Rickenella mellea]